MKILIDIDELTQNDVLTPEVAAKLRAHATRDTGGTAINVLLAFGAIAIACGLSSLFPSAYAGVLMGLAFILMGCMIHKKHYQQWGKLGSIWMVVGALILSGSTGMLVNHTVITPLVIAAILAWVAVIAESRLLIALVPLAIIAAIGGSAGHWEATYMVSVREPTITILLFSALAYASWQFAKRGTTIYHVLSIIFARVCTILVNMGFWIGSFFGDNPGHSWKNLDPFTGLDQFANPQIVPMVFIIGWAIVLILAGAWGAKNGRRFMVNTAAVFGSIHFYTQWFKWVEFNAFSVIFAGIMAIAIGLSFWRYNKKQLSA